MPMLWPALTESYCRVTGRFPLDPHRALQMLVDTLPIDVRVIAGLWVRIRAR